MAITEEEVKHIALLARLGLTDEEIKKLSSELTGILSYVDLLNEVDTDNVEPTSQVTGLENVYFDDEIEKEFCNKEELLECSPLEIVDDQIKVKNIFE